MTPVWELSWEKIVVWAGIILLANIIVRAVIIPCIINCLKKKDNKNPKNK